ncbi:MAG: hypothetical protein KKD63_06995 [Proteobacteria bacterium]|nr:hypothetical protein [Desulfobulbaceae bacterium]MBU4152609.1 hypothetical protein [Pseudomonadota bacterium]
MCRMIASLAIVAILVIPALVRADAVLEFSAQGEVKGEGVIQTMSVKDGRILVRGSGSSKHLDYLFDRWAQNLMVIDHRKRTIKMVDEEQVDRLNQQASTVQPLVQGLADQVAKLSPEERQKWQDLLGGSVSLDKIAQAAQPPPATTLMSAGQDKEVAGIRCKPMRIMQGTTGMADLCLADHAAIQIPDSDFATIRVLLTFYERLARRSQRVARQFGVIIPMISVREVTGVPIELRDLSRDDGGSVTLRSISTTAVLPDIIQVPAGYDTEPLTPWQ